MINSRIDATDITILSLLQKNGRMKNIDLAGKIALSASPCLQRVKRLEKMGLIQGYGAKIAINKIKDTIQVLTQFTINNDTLEAHQKFQQAIVHYPEVMDCFLGSGGFDYQVRFVCRSIEHYQSIIQIILDSDIQVKKYHSYVVMKEIVSRTEYPLSTLIDSETEL
ncbi:MAG: Lrp/AsnC family transcriptional regulator [Gammaproteobacteria bacterium]|nr:MAG: Lrp/AsnC family transcriptional regulator [Gammaproteobacteria bacterium]